VRILLAVHRFPPDSWGGAELYTLRLARGLIGAGHQAAVLTRAANAAGGPAFQRDEYDGVTVYRLGYALDATDNPIRDEYDHPIAAELARQVLAEYHPDLLHTTHCGDLSTSILAEAKAQGVRVVVTITDMWPICPNGLLTRNDDALCLGPDEIGQCARCYAHMGSRGASYARLADGLPLATWRAGTAIAAWPPMRHTRPARWLCAMAERRAFIRERLLRASAILCPGRFLREMLIRNGYPAERLTLAPHGIEQPGALKRRSPLAAETALRCGFFGPLAAHKGAHLPIAALARLSAETPVTLEYWGVHPRADDAYATSVRDAIQRQSRATHRGPFAPAALRDVLDGLDVLIVPSLCYENTPTVIYEALAHGIPVIVSDQGGMKELVETYRGGWLFPRGDVRALAELIERLARDREEVRRAAAAIAPIPSLEAHVAEVLRIYSQALGQEAT